MPPPRAQPREEIARPEKTAVRLDLLQTLLINGTRRIPRKNKESTQGTGAGMETFV